jgi:NADH-quinone oxidoreductase subunit E
MLTTEEKSELEKELTHCYNKRAGSIDALKALQKLRGWISDEALKDVADYLEMSPAELDNVATFYNMIFRKPVGRHVILVCDSVVCWMMGSETIAQLLSKKLGVDLGGTTTDGRFTMLPNSCLGACDHAPSMIVDDQLYTDLTADKLDAILEQYK